MLADFAARRFGNSLLCDRSIPCMIAATALLIAHAFGL
jgi:hypothetical protein